MRRPQHEKGKEGEKPFYDEPNVNAEIMEFMEKIWREPEEQIEGTS